MPGLLRGVARTAVIAGTATSVSNNVSRRQANRWAAKDQQAAAQQQSAQAQPQYAAPPQYAPPVVEDDATTAKLKQLAGLHAQGILTDAEFAAAKARALGI